MTGDGSEGRPIHTAEESSSAADIGAMGPQLEGSDPTAPVRSDPPNDIVSRARKLLPRSWNGEDVTQETEDLMRLAVAADDPDGECAILFVRVADASHKGDHEATRNTAAILVDRASQVDLPLWESRGRQFLARVHLAQGEEAAGIEELVTAEVLTDGMSEPSVMLTGAINGIATTYTLLGLYEDSERLFDRMSGMLKHVDDPWSHQALLYNRLLNDASWALALEQIGDPDEARARMRQASAGVQRESRWIAGSPVEDDIGLLILFVKLLSGRISVDAGRAQLAALSRGMVREATSFANAGLALRLTEQLRFNEAREAVRAGLRDLHPIDGEHVYMTLRWLSARIATLEEPYHQGLQEAWNYAELLSAKTWELRARRRDGVRDRLNLRRLNLEHQRVERASLEDALTGVANRRRIDRERQELTTAAGWTAVLYLDLDGFKAINDRLGHEIGDTVLRRVADLLHLSIRSHDLVGRYGGDEFVLIAHHCNVEEATNLGERVVRRVRRHPWWEVHPDLAVTISVGAAVTDRAYERLFEVADAALYEAKAAGRDRSLTRIVPAETSVSEGSLTP